ncbi:hypothetical protein BJ508DRAFT_418653 [Ascobolus immersus RN42]|uniref:Uncharacterized protein n=1 Tax=Ascobolus immersus RN42 TaxID=1160509 RepID=A0A3N4HRE5_ASCIM|nr:hypothetical protein BJ508DRAFT_418653 [Ascobolus immersus RN42]
MPVTFKVASHSASPLNPISGTQRSDALIQYTRLHRDYVAVDTLHLSSLNNYHGPTTDSEASSSPGNGFPLTKLTTSDQSGFVRTILSAYNTHHNLVLRPDDLWISIIAQFALFLEKPEHSEALRDWFTDSKEKKQIHIECVYLSQMPSLFREALANAVVDKELVPWITPSFTTTTEQDREVASYLLMGALKQFFDFSCQLCCGIPSVTLLGCKEDYEDILRRIDYFEKFDHDDLTHWAGMLNATVQKAFVDAFDSEKKDSVVNAWSKVCSYRGGGSGPTYLSGWLSAFTFFGNEGVPVMRGYGGKNDPQRKDLEDYEEDDEDLTEGTGLLGTKAQFGLVDMSDIATGVCEVKIKVTGLRGRDDEEVDMLVVAGSSSMGRGKLEGEGDQAKVVVGTDQEDDTVFPVNAWWMVEQDPKAQAERKAAEEKRLAYYERLRNGQF